MPKATVEMLSTNIEVTPSMAVQQIIVTATLTPTPSADDKSISVQELAKHNSRNDCWILIDKSVYEVTDYLDKHEGGANQILPYCGKDATTAFKAMTKHNKRADRDLITLFVGKIK